MPSLRYLHLDVFTNEPFTGNQLAVFPDPPALSTEVMQALAREMNFSESTFIYPAAGDGDVKMRIFTPGEELPIAGHPTIGSTFALALEGVIARGRAGFTFELGVGPTPVTMEWAAGGMTFAWMTQPDPEFGPVIRDRAALAAALGVDVAALATSTPAQRVSCGVPYVVVPMRDRAAVDAVVMDRRAFARCCEEAGISEIPVYIFTTDGDDATTYSRMLAPSFGISEDPATGSASGPLGCYLVQHGLLPAGEGGAIVNLQGVAMGRRSTIHISIDGTAGAITRVRVGGQAVLVGRGELTV